MARIPLIDPKDHPEFADLVAKFSAGRRGRLINIYRMLLNSPALAELVQPLNAVRWKTDLDGGARDRHNPHGPLDQRQYVLRQHVPALALADGVSLPNASARRLAGAKFSARERAALAYTDTMTRISWCPTKSSPRSNAISTRARSGN